MLTFAIPDSVSHMLRKPAIESAIRRADMYVINLRRYVAALAGRPRPEPGPHPRFGLTM